MRKESKHGTKDQNSCMQEEMRKQTKLWDKNQGRAERKQKEDEFLQSFNMNLEHE